MLVSPLLCIGMLMHGSNQTLDVQEQSRNKCSVVLSFILHKWQVGSGMIFHLNKFSFVGRAF